MLPTTFRMMSARWAFLKRSDGGRHEVCCNHRIRRRRGGSEPAIQLIEHSFEPSLRTASCRPPDPSRTMPGHCGCCMPVPQKRRRRSSGEIRSLMRMSSRAGGYVPSPIGQPGRRGRSRRPDAARLSGIASRSCDRQLRASPRKRRDRTGINRLGGLQSGVASDVRTRPARRNQDEDRACFRRGRPRGPKAGVVLPAGQMKQHDGMMLAAVGDQLANAGCQCIHHERLGEH